MEYYSALKRNYILTHATTWMNPEDNMLSEISQTLTDKCCMIPLNEVPRIVKFVKTESRMAVTSGRRNEEVRLLVLQDERILEMDGGNSCTKM